MVCRSFCRVRGSHADGLPESRLHSHVKTQLARHQPNISNLLKKYNELCVELQGFVRDGKATVGACAPRQLESNEVYSLDVDAPIWDDRGLNDGVAGLIPLWLGNDEVRAGIRSWLVSQRCDEEMKRLRAECNNLKVWASKEALMLHSALDTINGNIYLYFLERRIDYSPADPDLVYQISAKTRELNNLVDLWKSSIRAVAPDVASAVWGLGSDAADHPLGKDTPEREPEDGDAPDQPDDVDDSEDDSDNGELEADDRVLQEMELMNLPFGGDGSDLEQDEEVYQDGEDGGSEPSEAGSPSKRRRILL